MRKFLLVGVALGGCVMNAAAGVPNPAHQVLFDRPAGLWQEALPVGNGRLGAMVFGGVAEDRYQFNEDTLWSGHPHDYAHKGAAKEVARGDSCVSCHDDETEEQQPKLKAVMEWNRRNPL